MIFCAFDDFSLSFVRKTLQKFGKFLSLFANFEKSSMFVARVSSEAASLLASNLGFALGQLPVGYLGIPLLFGRLRLNDCAPLIQHITS